MSEEAAKEILEEDDAPGADLADELINVAPSFFEEPETMGSHRFSPRADVVAATPPVAEQEDDEDEDEPEAPVRPPRRHKIDEAWSSAPSIADQLIRAPDSVRIVGDQSAVFNLNDPAELKKWNEILTASAGEAPTLAIIETERNFHNGSYVLFVTYGRIEYRRL